MDKETTGKTTAKALLTIAILQEHIWQEKHIEIKWNVVKKQIDFINAQTGALLESETSGSASRMTPQLFATELYNELQGQYKGCNFTTIERFLDHIISTNRYNPVLQMIDKAAYDGSDQLGKVYKALHIPESDWLSRVLIKKWLWQALSLLRNNHRDNFETEGILVLQGEKQGSGKTTFCRILSRIDGTSQWFSGGREINFNDKDTLRRCISNFIVELGELDSTFKQDQAKIKSFITQDKDVYRVPYGRADTEELRYTSICATVNPEKYLVDPTGSRRFWTIPIDQEKEINHNIANSINALQLYKQIDVQAKKKPSGYKLTAPERTALMQRNGEFKRLDAAESEVLDIIARAKEQPSQYEWKRITVSEFKTYYVELNRYSTQQIGTALKNHGLEQIKTKQGRHYSLPVRKYYG